MRKLLCIIMALCLIFGGTVSASGAVVGTVAGGSTGDDSVGGGISYDLTDGVITISGKGSIKSNEFSNNNDIEKVVIEEGVTAIGSYAFNGCINLKSITIPDSVVSIGNNAFSDTKYYGTESNWENNVLYIGKHLIRGKASLSGSYAVKAGTKTICPTAFSYCTALTEINIPESVVSIGNGAFDNCTGLTGIDIPDSVTSIGESAFYGCSGLTDIDIPHGVTVISNGLFAECRGIKSINIPDSVTSIGANAFNYCTALEGIDLPEGVTEIGYNAFSGCTKIYALEIPQSVTFIDKSLFGQYGAKDRVILAKPGSLGESYAKDNGFIFVDSENPVVGNTIEGTNVNWSFNVASGVLTFSGKGAMPDFELSGNNPEWYSYRYLVKSVVIEEGITYVGNYTISRYYDNLQEVTTPASLEGLKYNAFPHGEKITFYGYAGSVVDDYVTERNSSTSNPTYTFVSIGDMPVEEIVVSNTKELREVITKLERDAKHKKVILKDGIYVLRKSLFMTDASNISFEAENTGKAEILSLNGNAPVIDMERCKNISLKGLIIGHFSLDYNSGCGSDDETFSSGYVIDCRQMDGLTIDSCDLYGCGTMGINSYLGKGLKVTNSVIRDCSENIVYESYSANQPQTSCYENCIMSANAYLESYAKKRPAITMKNSSSNAMATAEFKNCKFFNNMSTQRENDASAVSYPGSIFKNNVWDEEDTGTYGICLNGITWQIVQQGSDIVLKLGYDLVLDENTTIKSELGEVLPYSYSSLPWKGFTVGHNIVYNKVDLAPGVIFDDNIERGTCGDSISWTLNKSTGTLTLTGEGKMFEGHDVMWEKYENKITNIVIDDRITVINSNGFGNTAFVNNVPMGEKHKEVYSGKHLIYFYHNYENNEEYEYKVKEGTVSLPSQAFMWAKAASITIPQGVKVIPEHLFGENVKTVTLPSTITEIEKYVFNYCNNLTDIYFGGTINQWNNIFKAEGNDRLNSIIIHCTDGDIEPPAVTYETVGYGEASYIEITGLSRKVEKLVIPSAIEGYPVKSIRYEAFKGEGGIKEIKLPDTVENIGFEAFYKTGYYNNASNWENGALYIGDCLISVNEDTSGAFKIKDGTRLISAWAFGECRKITSISFPDSIRIINEGAFSKCSSIKELTIPDNVKMTGCEMFYECSSLEKVSLPSGYNFGGNKNYEWQSYDFGDCNKLKEIIISENNPDYCSIDGIVYTKDKGRLVMCPVAKADLCRISSATYQIGERAFMGAKAECVIIPESINQISKDAFSGCSDDMLIFFQGSESGWNNISIDASNNAFLEEVMFDYKELAQDTYTLSNPVVTADGNVKVDMEIKSGTYGTQCMILAMYDENNVFIGFKRKEVSAGQSSAEFDGIDSKAYSGKVFVWNGLWFMAPASNAAEVEIR